MVREQTANLFNVGSNPISSSIFLLVPVNSAPKKNFDIRVLEISKKWRGGVKKMVTPTPVWDTNPKYLHGVVFSRQFVNICECCVKTTTGRLFLGTICT